MSVPHSQRCCCCSPARLTPRPGSCPSQSSKRLFPRGLISDSILFGGVSVFHISTGRNMSIGSLPGCEISFHFFTPAIAIWERKDWSSSDVPDLDYQGAWRLFSSRDYSPRADPISRAFEVTPFFSCFLFGVSGSFFFTGVWDQSEHLVHVFTTNIENIFD